MLVSVKPDGTVIDRRRVTLVDDGLPSLPHHHDAQHLPIDEGVALVERVQASAEKCARIALETLAGELPATIRAIALRKCPPLPATIAERIETYSAQTKADTVMFRNALADAARARKWAVVWYEPKRVFDEAAAVLRTRTITRLLNDTGKSLGPPWQNDHRLAMAAAIAVAGTSAPHRRGATS